jgi:hypothetical protein
VGEITESHPSLHPWLFSSVVFVRREEEETDERKKNRRKRSRDREK